MELFPLASVVERREESSLRPPACPSERVEEAEEAEEGRIVVS